METKKDIRNMPGFVPQMEWMRKTWDRRDYPGLITGDRAHYKTVVKGVCVHCGELTYNVIDYLGHLTFTCSSHCV